MLRAAVALPMLLVATPVSATPPAKIADLAWMVGAWEGEGINGAPAVEVYSAPADGRMVGHFRQLNADGSVMFYELITIEESGGSLSYNIKHFNADLSGWEEKDEVRRFPLSIAGANSWDFSGIAYARTATGEMTATVASQGKDGKPEKLTFRFRRQ
jgi:hypothetical protein